MASTPNLRSSQLAILTFNHVPEHNPTFKYDRLGPLAVRNRRAYCARHGYQFVDEVHVDPARPACWAKIPALLDALERHSWVLWADSDTLVMNPERGVEEFLDPRFDLVVQSHNEFFEIIGMDPVQGLARMPINTGVFLVRASDWTRDFLQRTYGQTQFVTGGPIWDGIGEQEAMIHLLREQPEDLARIRYVEGLQNHPHLRRQEDLFVHFYGNHAQHRIPLQEADEVLQRWERAVELGEHLPEDLARFHWCCIQNKSAQEPHVRADLAHFLYSAADIEARP